MRRRRRVRRLVRLLAVALADRPPVGVEVVIRTDARPAIRSLRRAQRATRRMLPWRRRLRLLLPFGGAK